ncbi:MAG: aldose 1-epimerase [Pseudomonadota bacterium]
MSLVLKSGPMMLDLDPHIGGSVRQLSWRGIPILRPAPKDDDISPLDCGAFTMVPFSGRIADGLIDFHGTRHQIPPNFPPEPHAIHGFGWQSRWQIVACDAVSARLRHTPPEGAWPWEYEAQQLFRVTPEELRLTLFLVNKSDMPMPAGFGWHPYFPRENASLQADTHMVWLSEENMIPSPPVLVTPHFDLTRTRPVRELNMDNAFSIGSTVQHMTWPDRVVTLSSDPDFTKLIVYVPPGETYFCVEPATHAPNAINSDLPASQTGLIVLKPRQALSATIRLTVSAP